MQIFVEITPDLDKLASKFGTIDVGSFLERIIVKFAFMIEGEAKRVTPVDTGRLRASISTSQYGMRAVVAPHTNYAFFVHEGTRRMKSRPFMKWGVERASRGLETLMVKDLTKHIEEKIK